MGIANIINSSNASSGGEIVRELVNSSDGQGLHFDGSAGHILREVVSAPAVGLGTKFSLEYVVKADEWKTSGSQHFLVDFGDGGRVIFGTGNFTTGGISGNLGIYSNSTWGDQDFGVKVLDDLKVHHLVVTVDGTSAVLYDNGNQVGTTTIGATDIDSCKDFAIGSAYSGSAHFFNGTIYRCRFWNKALSSTEVQTAFERADVPFASQHGSQTELVQNGTDWTGASGTTPPSYWTVGNVATFTIDPTSGSGDEPALQIEKNGANPSMYQTQTVEVGKQYRVTYRVKNNNATNVTVRIGSTANGSEYNSLVVSSTSWNTVTRDVTATTTTLSVGVEVTTSTASQSGYIDSVSVVQTGVVQDLDLAFANPSQSLTVQDRAGNSDGTASSSGLTQVQPIIQGNMRSLAVTTSQQAAGVPADGRILADGITLGNETITKYSEGTFTPTLQFGGSSSGITYSNVRGGVYTRIGRICYIQIAFVLTSKGTQTGNAVILGLPFNAGDLIDYTTVENAISFSAFSGRSDTVGSINGTSLIISNMNGNSLTNTNFTNTTSVRLAGCYALASS